jgi:hypothetical protein
MKPEVNIHRVNGTFTATITNGSISPVHIHGCETEEIARQQAKDRIRELENEGILKHNQ